MEMIKLDIQKFAALITREDSVKLTSKADPTYAYGTLYVKMVENSTSTANNTSNITITASITQVLGSYAQYGQPTLYLKWHDNKGYTTTKEFKSQQVSALSRGETVTLTHTFNATHNDDGKLEGYAIAEWYYEKTGYAPRSGSVSTASKGTALTTIPRHLSWNSFTNTYLSETRMSFSWSVSDAADKVILKYKKSGDTNYINYETIENSNGIKSGTFTIKNLDPNTKYDIKINARRADSQLDKDSSVLTLTTFSFPYIESIRTKDLIIGNTQTFQVYNPLGREWWIRAKQENWSGPDNYSGISDYTTGKTTSITPNATILYKSITTKKMGNMIYQCVCMKDEVDNSENINSYTNATYSCNPSDCYPVVSNMNLEYKDLNDDVVVVTTDNQYLVQQKSRLGILFNAAIPQNEAIISSYKITFGSMYNKHPVSLDSTNYIDLGIVTLTQDTPLSLVVVDSRGFETKLPDMTVKILPWKKPTVKLEANRKNDFDEITTAIATMTNFSELKIGEDIKNSYEIFFNYYEGTDLNTPLLAEDVQLTSGVAYAPNGGDFLLDQNQTYTLVAYIKDKFGKGGEDTAFVNQGIPIMMIDGQQFGVGVNCFPDGKGLYVDGATKLGNGHYNFDSPSTGTSGGYIHLLDITSRTRWQDMFIVFDVLQRERSGSVEINFTYTDVVGELKVQTCKKRGNIECYYNVVYNADGTTTTISLYVKADYYDIASVCNLRKPKNTSHLDITWAGEHVADLPSGYSTATTFALEDTYPVGAIYISTVKTSPASLFGGEWTRITDKFLLGATDSNAGTSTTAQSTGASSKSSTDPHTLTAAQSGIQNHAHNYTQRAAAIYTTNYVSTANKLVIRGSNGYSIDHGNESLKGNYQYGASNTIATTSKSANATEGHSHGMTHTHTQTLPPYLAVYMWKRTK